jgi:multicomponent Na+:H+ antiporter subunit E
MFARADKGKVQLWPLIRRGLLRTVLFAILWWVLTRGETGSWLIGIPAVAAAGISAAMLTPTTGYRMHLAGLLRFIPFFVWRSLVGSADVAGRALHPRLPISPSLETYPLRLPADGPARVVFANVVNLLPGTLSAELHEESLSVHALSGGACVLKRLQELEEMVAALFGLKLACRSPSQVFENE